MIETGYGGNGCVPTSQKIENIYLFIYLLIRLVDIWKNYRFYSKKHLKLEWENRFFKVKLRGIVFDHHSSLKRKNVNCPV